MYIKLNLIQPLIMLKYNQVKEIKNKKKPREVTLEVLYFLVIILCL